MIAIEKNKKAKISLNNSKLMNENELSNYQISKLTDQSRKNIILMTEVENDIDALAEDSDKLINENS